MAATKTESPYTTDDHFDMTSWAEHYNLLPELLTLSGRTFDPIATVDAISDIIEDTPDTAKTVNAATIVNELPFLDRYYGVKGGYIDFLATMFGAWKPTCKTRGTAPSYINPDYIHIGNLHDEYVFKTPEARLSYLDTVTRHGRLSYRDIAPAFGLTEQGMDSYLTKSLPDPCLRERRKVGHKNFACTIYTIHDWEEYTYYDLADAFNMPRTTLTDHVQRYVPDDYTVPDDPSANDYKVPTEFRY